MAYTYDDFVSAASKAGMLGTFSQHDLQTAQKSPEFGLSLLSLKQDSAKATTAQQRVLADEAANQLRKTYGNYTVGPDGTVGYAKSYGSEVEDLLGQIRSYGSFKYDKENAYQKLLDTVANQEAFEYDHATDPQFSSMRKAYLREGERATANALAKAAAANGGRVSSWAAGAAAQAGNYYASQVADLIPTLRQNAYTEYLNKISNNLSALNALESDRTLDYQTYLGELDRLQTTLGNYQSQEATNYARYLDQWSQAAQAEQLAREQKQQEQDNALKLLQTLGYATPEVAKVLGLDGGLTGTENGTIVDGDVPAPIIDPAPIVDPDIEGNDVTVIPADILKWLEGAYPNGRISDKDDWDNMKALYGEETLRAAGYYYEQLQRKPVNISKNGSKKSAGTAGVDKTVISRID